MLKKKPKTVSVQSAPADCPEWVAALIAEQKKAIDLLNTQLESKDQEIRSLRKLFGGGNFVEGDQRGAGRDYYESHYYGTSAPAESTMNPFEDDNVGKDVGAANPFKYNSGSVLLFGRDLERACLKAFCEEKPEFFQELGDFSWYAISGDGGTGKTRLAHDLLRIMKNDCGWHCGMVKTDFENTMNGALQNIKCGGKYLLVMDYIKWFNADKLREWIQKLQLKCKQENAIVRLLFVERIPRAFNSVSRDERNSQYQPDPHAFRSIDTDTRLMSLNLEQLGDDDLRQIIEGFADWLSNHSKADEKLSRENLSTEAVLEALKGMNNPARRPLFAMFMTHASMANKDVRGWKANAALDYVYTEHERKRIVDACGRCAQQVAGQNPSTLTSHKSTLERCALQFLVLGTLTMGISWDELEQSYTDDCKALDEIARHLPDYKGPFIENSKGHLIGDILEITENAERQVGKLEPDLLGEYFCIRELLLYDHTTRAGLKRIAEQNENAFAVVCGRVQTDYGRRNECLLNDERIKNFFAVISTPESMNAVDPWTYAETFLSRANIAEKVEAIGESAFARCENLSTIRFSGTACRDIGESAFADCMRLHDITLPEGLRTIGLHAFDGCASLKSIVIPASVTHIGAWAFCGCTKLESVTICSANTEIDVGAFHGCAKLRDVSIPQGTVIHARAFGDCAKLAGKFQPHILDQAPPEETMFGLEWLLLDVEEGKGRLYIAKNVLYQARYHKAFEPTTWAECELHSKLQKELLPKLAKKDPAMAGEIQPTLIHTPGNPRWNTSGGDGVTDQIWLLSIEEAQRYFNRDGERTAKFNNDAAWWWLRSPGVSQYDAATVDSDGTVDLDGDDGNGDGGGVRPALWLNP